MDRVGSPWGSGWSETGALGWDWDHSCNQEACTGAQPLGEDLKITLVQRGRWAGLKARELKGGAPGLY